MVYARRIEGLNFNQLGEFFASRECWKDIARKKTLKNEQ